MDMNSLVSTLLSSSAVSGISQSANTSKKDAANVLNAALPLLLNGAKEQSQNSATSESFANALLSHGKVDASNIGSFLQSVDLKDGGKIVNHLLGANSNAVADIAKEAGVSKKNTGNILAAAAPLLMTLLGQSAGSGNAGANASLVGSLAASLLGNLDVGSLLGGLLGADTQQTTTTTTANGKKKKKKKPAASNNNNNSNGGGILGALLNLLRG